MAAEQQDIRLFYLANRVLTFEGRKNLAFGASTNRRRSTFDLPQS
jgi:hypothetical protein